VTSLYTRAVEVGDWPAEADVSARGTWGADDRAWRLRGKANKVEQGTALKKKRAPNTIYSMMADRSVCLYPVSLLSQWG
jgi:hypothetical protein